VNRHGAELRLWKMLAKVREIRLARARRALALARATLTEATLGVERVRAALDEHRRQQDEVLDFCRHDERAGANWHRTLRAHLARTPVLERTLNDAQRALHAARAELARAVQRCERAQFRIDDAGKRIAEARRSLLAAETLEE
jgi:hypothetical protein